MAAQRLAPGSPRAVSTTEAVFWRGCSLLGQVLTVPGVLCDTPAGQCVSVPFVEVWFACEMSPEAPE